MVGGTGKFSTTSGQGEMMLTTTLIERELKIPEEGVTGNFTGKAVWPALKITKQ